MKDHPMVVSAGSAAFVGNDRGWSPSDGRGCSKSPSKRCLIHAIHLGSIEHLLQTQSGQFQHNLEANPPHCSPAREAMNERPITKSATELAAGGYGFKDPLRIRWPGAAAFRRTAHAALWATPADVHVW